MTRSAAEPAVPSAAHVDSQYGTKYDRKGVALMAWAHFAHDLYPSFLGVLVPAVQTKLAIPLAVASLMVPAQQMPSILQPFFGYLADRTSRRWFVILTPAAAAVSLSLVGLAPHFAVVVVLLLVSGLSSAAFHAPAVALVGEFGGQRTGRAMAIFMTGGELARTLGPLLLTATIALLTLEGTTVVMIVGLAAALSLFFTLDTRRGDVASQARRDNQALRPLLRQRWRPILGLLGVTVLNTVAVTPMTFFLVKLLQTRGHSDIYGGIALSTLYASAIAGSLIGGTLSDHVGHRSTLALSSLLTAPLMFCYLALENGSWAVLGLIVLIGLAVMPPRPVTLALANDLVPEARGPMAGLTLATSFVAQSLAALGFGVLADLIGIGPAFWWSAGVSFLGLLFVPLIPPSSAARASGRH
jgi:FSR family fosmidomycin resistance protein-like MFS transporter